MKKYKYKLNMLEPGLKMVKIIGVLIVIGLVCYAVKVILLSYLLCGLAAVLGIILWVLILAEQHQDKVLNQQAIEERRRNGED